MAPGTCDFCSSPTGEGKRGYRPAAHITLQVPGIDYVDVGEWVACAGCSELIERKDWRGLMDRAALLNPGLRAAYQQGKLRECAAFVAESWSAVFDQPPAAFL
jgi:hypothetical protein